MSRLQAMDLGKNSSCEDWSNIQIFMKNMFKGMYAPRLIHIHVEKTMLQIKPPLIPLGPLGPYFIFNMLTKGNKLSIFYANP